MGAMVLWTGFRHTGGCGAYNFVPAKEATPMVRTLTKILAGAVVLLCVVTTHATAQMKGTVKSVDGKGMITVKMDDGTEHQVQMRGVREGDPVECELAKNGKLECKEPKKGGM